MRQFRLDISAHPRSVLAFGAFWLALLAVTALTWNRGMPGWVFFIHLLPLPLLAGIAMAGFHLNSGVAGMLVSLIDLAIISIVPEVALSLSSGLPPSEERLFTGWAAVFEVLEFVILMGVPGFLLGLLGGTLGRWFSARRPAR